MTIPPRTSLCSVKFLLARVFCAATALSASSDKESAQRLRVGANSSTEPPEIPLEQQPEQKLDHRAQDNVDMYLKVMRGREE